MKHTATMNENVNVVHGEFGRGMVARVLDSIKLWNSHRIAIRDLNGLSDRLLSDIGIKRTDIASAVKGRGKFSPIEAQAERRTETPAKLRRAA